VNSSREYSVLLGWRERRPLRSESPLWDGRGTGDSTWPRRVSQLIHLRKGLRRGVDAEDTMRIHQRLK
jgi:hypothetical protein